MNRLVIFQDGVAVEVSRLLISLTWSGRLGGAARSVDCTLLNDRRQVKFDLMHGAQLLFYRNETELFRGMIRTRAQNPPGTLQLTAYDDLIRFANNKDSFHYANQTATAIFNDLCQKFGVKQGSIVADTGYKIAKIEKCVTTAWDVLAQALEQTTKQTGRRYYPLCANGGRMFLLERRAAVRPLVIEPGANLLSYSVSESIENVKTRVKLYRTYMPKSGKKRKAESAKPEPITLTAKAADKDLELFLGTFQDAEQVSDDLNQAELNKRAAEKLKEAKQPKRTINITALGHLSVVTGVGVYVRLPEADVDGVYYVEQDTHTFNGNAHTMSLTLETATDI